MKPTAVMMTVLSGLCFLSACFPHEYILVDHEVNWDKAQDYCRRTYTDLATVLNKNDLSKLEKVRAGRKVWIGLRADTDAWTWSLDDPDYYGEGQTEYRNWFSVDEMLPKSYEACVALLFTGEWVDFKCNEIHTFLCYTNSTKASSPVIFVDMKQTWMEAQQYCRKHYTDLASVRTPTENKNLQTMKKDPYVWIGLYRNSWKWSDGSPHSFSHWDYDAPSNMDSALCVSSDSDRWINTDCRLMRQFICYHAHKELNKNRKVVKVVLWKSDLSVDMEEPKEDILIKLHQRLEEPGLGGSVTLTWLKQPDGKTFHTIKGEEEEEKCPILGL